MRNLIIGLVVGIFYYCYTLKDPTEALFLEVLKYSKATEFKMKGIGYDLYRNEHTPCEEQLFLKEFNKKIKLEYIDSTLRDLENLETYLKFQRKLINVILKKQLRKKYHLDSTLLKQKKVEEVIDFKSLELLVWNSALVINLLKYLVDWDRELKVSTEKEIESLIFQIKMGLPLLALRDKDWILPKSNFLYKTGKIHLTVQLRKEFDKIKAKIKLNQNTTKGS